MINLIVHNQNKILKIYKEYEATKPSEIINVKDRTKVECYLQFIEELSERTNTNETSDKHETEQLNILGVVRSFSGKAELINALTNTMKVNEEHLGTYHQLRDDAYEKLIKVINSLDF